MKHLYSGASYLLPLTGWIAVHAEAVALDGEDFFLLVVAAGIYALVGGELGEGPLDLKVNGLYPLGSFLWPTK